LNPTIISSASFNRKHKHSRSLTKGLRSLITNEHTSSDATPKGTNSKHSRSSSLKEKTASAGQTSHTPSTTTTEFNWEAHDEAALRLATDYVPLGQPSSKLSSLDISSFDLYQSGSYGGSSAFALLAIASKSTILLYEASAGERVFRFHKVTDCNDCKRLCSN
jgi:hypothetical protein